MITDVYTCITDLKQGVRPWMQPWNAEHAAGGLGPGGW
jgi:antirestriction protein ArdC